VEALAHWGLLRHWKTKIIKPDHRNELIITDLTELMIAAANQTKMKPLTFQQSVTCE
jgi:hypothetical protein